MLRRLPAAYLAAALAVAATRAVSGHPKASALALTPDRLGSAKVWLFLTSAVVVNGPVLPQLAALVATVGVAARRLGSAYVGGLMVVAHVGSTLLAYGTLAALTGDADGADNRNLDYGVSAAWLGALGALSAAALPRARRREPLAMLVVALGALAFVAGVALFPLLASTEHGFAFAIGVAAAAFWPRPAATAPR